ncbi:MAG TPA: hypothetical protein VM165_20395 [Planctomycetaceae bacterium]|nr:hypothetical protein [Planctomycetaceae bacterium]
MFRPSLTGAALGLVLAAAATAAEPEAPGIVRISKPAATVRAQSDGFVQPVAQQVMAPVPEYVAVPDNSCPNGDCWGLDGGYGGKWGGKSHGYYSHGMLDYFKCKFGYFFPTGCGGAGCPPIGKYARVYPQNPAYHDHRDGQIWAAQGYGVPIAVPLAPVVGHQYNYSWGTPASRLTPISRVAPY